METKREKFVRLAEARTNKIIKMIELLGNLSNTSSYEYTEEEVNRIYETIYNELNLSRDRFGYGLKPKVEPFKLNSGNSIINATNECVEKRIDLIE